MEIVQFVGDYPSIGVLIIGLLFAAVVKLITHPYNNLTSAIKALTEIVKEGHNEAKEYREKDKEQVGEILDRLQKQETLCATVRSFCPHANRIIESTPPTNKDWIAH